MMKVKYVGKMDVHDLLTTGLIYTVVNENKNKFIVINDFYGKSKIKKDKFEIV